MKQFYAFFRKVTQKENVLFTFFLSLFAGATAQTCVPVINAGSPSNVLYRAVEARWKGLNNTSGANTALYLGNNNMGSGGTNRVETSGNGLYVKPGETNISFKYNKAADNLVATVGSRTVTYNNVSANATGNMGTLTFMHILLRSGSTGNTGLLTLKNIVLDGFALGDVQIGAATSGNWTIRNYDFSNGFNLTATIVLDAGTYASNEGSKVDIWVGNNNDFCNTPAYIKVSGNIWYDKNGNTVKDGSETFASTGSFWTLAKHTNGPNAGKIAAISGLDVSGQYDLHVPSALVESPIGSGNFIAPTYEINVTNYQPTIGSNYGSPAQGDLGAPAGHHSYYVTNPDGAPGNASKYNEIGRFEITVSAPFNDLVDQNIGLQSPPTTDFVNTALPSRPIGTFWELDNDDQLLSGNDAEDGLFESGMGKTFRILSNPTVQTAPPPFTLSNPIVIKLAYDANGNGPDAADIIDASADPDDNIFVDIPNYDRSRLYVFFESGTGNYVGSFSYSALDAASAVSPTPSLYSFTAILPVNGIELAGSYNAGKSTLRWTVKSIDDADHFVLERSQDGTAYKQIATMQRSGSSYQFVDNLNGFAGNDAYYRVKLVRKNGSISYSNMLKVKMATLTGVQFTPTVVKTDLQVRFNNPRRQDLMLRVVSLSGQVVSTQRFQAGEGNVSLNVPGFERLPNGTYVVQISFGSQTEQAKIFIQH